MPYQNWKRGMRLETAATIPQNLTRGSITAESRAETRA